MRISLRTLFGAIALCSVALAQYVGTTQVEFSQEWTTWGLPTAEILLLDVLALVAVWRVRRKNRRTRPADE